MIISTERIISATITNQLFFHSEGAKKPKTYSTKPKTQKSRDNEYLYASFKCIDDRTQSSIPVDRITTLFNITLVV